MKSLFIGIVELSWHCLKVITRYSEVKAIFTFKSIKIHCDQGTLLIKRILFDKTITEFTFFN